MNDFRAALWVEDFSKPVASLNEWLSLVAAKAAESAALQADILVMPEYACCHWLSFVSGVQGCEHIGWLERRREEALAGISKIARDSRIAIMPGTFPVLAAKPYATPLCRQPNDKRGMEATRYYNRAYVFNAAGDVIATQDKLVLTPWELDEKSWNVHGGSQQVTFDINGARCGILICLDVQQPQLAQRLFAMGIDVLLVPSMTLLPTGHARVFSCAKARAIEGLVGVAAVGAVGEPLVLVGKETNYSAAAAYAPCEMDIAETGTLFEAAGSYGMTFEAGALHVVTIPVGKIRERRTGKPEAWAGLIAI